MSPERIPVGTIKAEHVWKRFRPDLEGSMLRAEADRLREDDRKALGLFPTFA